MRTVFTLTALSFFVLGMTSARSADLQLDAEKSTIEFVGSKADGKHTGGFKKFAVTGKEDHDNPEKSEIKIEIETDSLYSDDNNLTQHLKNPDFFNVRKFPKISFQSKKIVLTGEATADITGIMTMLDKDVEITIPVKVEMTEETLTLHAEFKIDRTKWGMNYGQGKINNDVEVKSKMVFIR